MFKGATWHATCDGVAASDACIEAAPDPDFRFAGANPAPHRRARKRLRRIAWHFFFLRVIKVFVDFARAFRTVERRDIERVSPMPKLTKRLVNAAETRKRRSRRISLGPSTVLTCEQARNRAIAVVAAARGGEDPAAGRDA